MLWPLNEAVAILAMCPVMRTHLRVKRFLERPRLFAGLPAPAELASLRVGPSSTAARLTVAWGSAGRKQKSLEDWRESSRLIRAPPRARTGNPLIKSQLLCH